MEISNTIKLIEILVFIYLIKLSEIMSRFTQILQLQVFYLVAHVD